MVLLKDAAYLRSMCDGGLSEPVGRGMGEALLRTVHVRLIARAAWKWGSCQET